MTTKRQRTWTAVMLAVLLMAGTAKAQVIFANADAHIDGVNTQLNYGAATTLRMRGRGSPAFKTYIRFSLDAVPDLSAVKSATLSLTSTSWAEQTFSVYGLKDGLAGENWIEGSGGNSGATATAGEITWSNAPANNTNSPAEFTSDAILLGTFSMTGGTNATVDFSTEALANFLKSDTNGTVTFMLASGMTGVTNITSLATRTHATTPPKLTIAVPEPGSVGAIVLAGAGLLLGRRRGQR